MPRSGLLFTCKNDLLDDGYSCTFENVMYPGNWDTPGKENMQLNNIHDWYSSVSLTYC